MGKKRVKVMITAFRDGFQSVYGARVFSKDFLPAVEATAKAGIEHFEAGGGAMFQSAFFYCNENAFDVMDAFRKAAGPNANLQTLARGINVVCLDSQPSDIIKLHAQMFKKHGITTIRNFDALNDVNNLIYSGKCIKEAGLKHEVVVTMMSLPPDCPGADYAHTPDFYEKTLKGILDAGIPFDSVAFKDASGTSTPAVIYETMKRARNLLGADAHIRFHSHDTAGTCVTCYKAALDGGADGLDLSMAPVSGGTCQSDILSMWHALRGTEYDLGIDVNKMVEAEEVFKNCMADYFLPPESKAVEPLIPFSPMPGGALTANTQMMRDNGTMDRYPEVIKAMNEVVKVGGFGTSVTPVSQFYFQQAYNNVFLGPWKKFAEGYGKMVLGYFGKTPVEPDPEIVKLAEEQMGLKRTTESPLAINDRNEKKGVAATKKILQENKLPETDENIFIVAACGDKGVAYLKGEATVGVRKDAKKSAGGEAKASGSGEYTVDINGKAYAVQLKGDEAVVDGRTYKVNVKDGISASAPASSGSGEGEAVKSPLPGVVVKIKAPVGTSVAAGQTVIVIEAMKMETEIKTQKAGVVASIPVAQGAKVLTGQVLFTIK
ncbi:MAG TPA: biotin attachment protein [Spirochaetota bacterium]|mgnify:FL=1|nr:biotin attachment protein [Spirochaetota bacterium]HQE59595.1 biotin attachment protein [Spirochaetota bacterium]